jgi:hypothetical protein
VRSATSASRPPWSATRTGPRLDVHAWRFANENTYLPADFRVGPSPTAWGDHAAEYRLSTGWASTAC